MNKKLLYQTLICVFIMGLVSTAALASAPPPAPALPGAPNASISGVVTTDMGVPISGVTIQATTGISTTNVTTDVYGSYLIPNLPDGTYTLIPVFGSYTFTPPSRMVTVPPDATDQNFVYIPPKPPNPKIFLPMLAKDLVTGPEVCPDFSDDFSNPDSGWHVGEDQDYRAEYLNAEYRVLAKTMAMYYWFGSPTCNRENYSVEVDARWEGNDGWGYGLVFGMVGDSENFYVFEVNTYLLEYSLLRSYPSGFAEIVPPTPYSGIRAGNATNHLKATRNGTAITLEINGATIGTWNDANIGGPTGSGVSVSTYSDVPNADARFDNFKVTSLGGSALFADQDKPLKQAEAGADSSARDARILSVSGVGKAAKGPAAQHDLSSLLSVQGTYCIPDGAGGCALFVPPYPNFIGWSDPDDEVENVGYFSLVDYAGLVDQWIEANCGISLGTEISGSVVKRPEKDGRTRVTVNLHTQNALAWVTKYTETDFPGQMLFGHFAEEVCAGEEPALADSYLKMVYFVAEGKDPNLDLIRLTLEDPTDLAEEGYELISLVFEVNGSGPLREAYGVPDGTPGNLHITQVGTLNFDPEKLNDPVQTHTPWDGYPVEMIELRVIGN